MPNKRVVIVVSLIVLVYCLIYYWANDIQIHVIGSGVPGPTILMIGGTHGNEPAGSVALNQLIGQVKVKRGRLIIVPCANKLGLLLNTRWLPHRIWYRDLNRNYPRISGEIPLEPISQKISQLALQADFILDLHEGWGYHRIQPDSMGSGIYPGDTKLSLEVATKLANHLNKNINADYKKFVVGYNNHPELNSLRSFCVLHNRNYILVETTGQNNIQPLDVRVPQHLDVIYETFRLLKILKIELN